MAIGFLECAGCGALLYAMDKACKAADITIIGVDTINPKDATAFIPMTAQVKFEGNISQVKIAVDVAKREALKFNKESEVLTSVIERPYAGTKKLSHITKMKFMEEKIIYAKGTI